MWLEKLGVVALIAAAIYACRWMWLNEPMPDAVMWGFSICILPLAVLMLGEKWGRFIQKR
jgi:hypothetical protein